MDKKFTVIYCPNEAHRGAKRVLCMIAETGEILVKCKDSVCKRANDGKNWYLVKKNEVGGFEIKLMDRQKFNGETEPIMVLEE